MNYAAGVCIFQGGADLDDDIHCCGQIEGLASPPQFTSRRAAVHVFHGYVVEALHFARFVDFDDVGVIQSLCRLNLPVESLQELGVVLKVGRQHLQGDIAALRRLVGLVNDGHPASPDFLDGLIFTETLAD